VTGAAAVQRVSHDGSRGSHLDARPSQRPLDATAPGEHVDREREARSEPVQRGEHADATRSARAPESGRGRWLVIAATFFWGTSATLARFAFRDHHVPPLTAVVLRLVLAVTILGAWIAWRRPAAFHVDRKDWGYFLILALFGLAAVQGSYYYSIAALGVGMAILIQYLAPTLLVLFDLARGAHVTGRTIAAAGAALSGTVLLIGNIDPHAVHARPIEWAVSFSAALSFAFYIVYSKRGLARYGPETVLFHTFWIAGVFWMIVTPPWKILAAGYTGNVWLMFLALALFSTLVPFVCFNAGLRRLPATQAGILSTMEPVIAVISAAVFLGEALRPLQNVGAFLVLVAAALSSYREPDR
jgi:drug/metabolite transporter (DMT)-like permease